MNKNGLLWKAAAMAAILTAFGCALLRLESGREEMEKQRILNALQRAAAACYAAEGAYPPDLAYMQEHYGIRYDSERYTVVYDVFASNLMPDITVLDQRP